MRLSDFKKITEVVIDKLEGGYYHPQMLKDGRVTDKRYESSGETMFGIDRNYLGNPSQGEAQKKFWALIDKVDAKNKWSWNYMGGSLNKKLKDLASEIIYPEYEKLSKQYLSDKSKRIVDRDPRLTFNFAYATWNGAGWFKRFADKINESVAKGITSPNKLTDIAVKVRTESANSLIAQGGKKIDSFIQDLKGFVSRNKYAIGFGILTFGLAATATIYYFANREKIGNLKLAA